VLRHTVISELRKQSSHELPFDDGSVLMAPEVVRKLQVPDDTDRIIDGVILRAALGTLSPAKREAIQRVYLGEGARGKKGPLSGIERSRLAYGRGELRAALEETGIDSYDLA